MIEAYISCYSIQIQRGKNFTGNINLLDCTITYTEYFLQYILDDNEFMTTYLFSRKDQLACCSDNTSVKIFDSYREMMQMYEDNSHCDFVRGLAWYKDNLYSCSWDANVIKHTVNIAD